MAYSRIICGDSFYELDKLEPESVDCVFTSPDPPDTPAKMSDLIEIIKKCTRVIKDTGSLWIQLGDYHDDDGREMMSLPERFILYMKTHMFLKSKLVWHRPSNTPREDLKRFKRDWEYVLVYTKMSSGYYFDENACDTSTSVFTFPYVEPKPGEFVSGFPEDLIQLAIDTAVPERGTILDPFCGSGTTGVVALRNGCSFIGIEQDSDKISKIAKRLRDKFKFIPHVRRES
jgi:site-specific DNA-methyltransferase (adenine-specific)